MNKRWLNPLYAILAIILLSGCAQAPRPQFSPLPLPELSEQDKTSTDSHHQLGWNLLLSGEPDKALKELKLSRSPDRAVFTGFGYVYLVKKNYLLSEKNFRKALAAAPDDMMAQSGLGLLYEMMGKSEEAFSMYRAIKKLYPNNPWAESRYDHLRAVLTEMQIKKAESAKNSGDSERYLRELERAQYYSPEMSEIALKIAARYQEMGMPEKAIYAYRQLIKSDPHNQVYLQNLAQIYVSMKAFDNALILYRQLLDLNPNDEQIKEKCEQVKKAFDESAWPHELKSIFYKEQLNREDTAALIGLYFPSILSDPQKPLIISDISGSFAFADIIKVCASGIMTVRPDHRFDRFGLINRGLVALILDRLIKVITESGRTLDFQPIRDFTPPHDILPTHRDYQTITSLLSINLLELDESNQFRPLDTVHPDELINALKKIEMVMRFVEKDER